MAVEYSEGFGGRSLGVRFHYTGDEFAKALEEVEGRFDPESLTIPLTEIARDLMWKEVLGNIDTQGRGTWPAMSSETIDRHGSHPLLRDDNELYGSIFYRVDSGSAKVFSAVSTGLLHERGRRAGFVTGHRKARVRKNETRTREEAAASGLKTFGISAMPARPFMFISDETVDKAEDTILDYILDPIDEAAA